MSQLPIEDHGVIGDLNTVALVGIDGTIDFMCFPDFDSPSIFASLLDEEKGGHFKLAPAMDNANRKQIYLPDSNILLTRFLSEDGVAEVSDFMPVEECGRCHSLIRRAKCVRGRARFRLECLPRFDYARSHHRVERCEGGVLFVPESERLGALRLHTSVEVDLREGAAVAEFDLEAGDSVAFVLEHAEPGEESPACDPRHVPEMFKATVNHWRRWMSRCAYQGRWREMVNRSALTLKLLVSRQHGSIVAAPTFGLPENVGGERNWDYRYTWIRDASFTVYAFVRLGMMEETEAFMRWIQERCNELEPDGSLQVMYGLDGHHDLTEIDLDHLAGHRGSRPVRIGNRAHTQLQLDIYGELMDSVYLYNKFGHPIPHGMWTNICRLVDWVCENWKQPDEGIWEVRGGRHDFLYSRVMCWVAVDRAVRLVIKRSLPAPFDRWRLVRDEIYRDIFENFWNEERGFFAQYAGADHIDASSLIMPLVKFMSPADPYLASHMRVIEEELVGDSLVSRYRPDKAAPDGLRGHEGTFSMCSFWYVECLARMGDIDKARFCFDKMLGYANHLGLYAEEIGPRGEHLGNFPQAFTHLALISAAHWLDRVLDASPRSV